MSTVSAVFLEFLVLAGALFYCTANGNSPLRVLPALALTIGQLIWVVHERTDFLVIFGGVAVLFALLLGLVLGQAAWQARCAERRSGSSQSGCN